MKLKIKLPEGLRLWICRRWHVEHWESVDHGHRKCSKCGFDWRRGKVADVHSIGRMDRRMPR